MTPTLVPTGYGHSDADALHQSFLEANIATEVCLTALNTLSLFTLAFKVWALGAGLRVTYPMGYWRFVCMTKAATASHAVFSLLLSLLSLPLLSILLLSYFLHPSPSLSFSIFLPPSLLVSSHSHSPPIPSTSNKETFILIPFIKPVRAGSIV